ncbi:hypothetical protein JR065_19965 [Xanthomonas sp. AmX2]|uniref:hypothetical protein n=1 Tax=Xanthomonas sp. TaxID=29446 RepID=UPI001981853B|nr:hypothetical protein [Xanthomonas sp.]MBN6152614.1 hypothetical protein [Xanthomonas sp.]
MPSQDASPGTRFVASVPEAAPAPPTPPPGIGAHRYRVWGNAAGARCAVRQGWSWPVFLLPYPPSRLPWALWGLAHLALWLALVQALGALAAGGGLAELLWRVSAARRGHRWRERRLRAAGWRPQTRVLAIHAEAALLTVAIRGGALPPPRAG